MSITQTLAAFSQSATGAVADYYGTGIRPTVEQDYIGGAFTPLPHATVHLGSGHWAKKACEADGGVVAAAADSQHVLGSDEAAVTEHASLTPLDSAHPHSSDQVVISSAAGGGLLVQGSSHGHASEQATLTEHPVLAVDESFHALTSDNATVVTAGSLLVEGSSHALASDSATVVEHSVLVVGESLHTLTSDSATVVESGLLVEGSLHALTSDPATLIEHPVLAVGDSLHALTSGNVAVNVPEVVIAPLVTGQARARMTWVS